MSDYHIRMKTAASTSSDINLDATNRHQCFRAICSWHEKLAPESGVGFMAPISEACVGLKTNIKLQNPALVGLTG